MSLNQYFVIHFKIQFKQILLYQNCNIVLIIHTSYVNYTVKLPGSQWRTLSPKNPALWVTLNRHPNAQHVCSVTQTLKAFLSTS